MEAFQEVKGMEFSTATPSQEVLNPRLESSLAGMHTVIQGTDVWLG